MIFPKLFSIEDKPLLTSNYYLLLEEMSLKAETKEVSDYYTSIKQDITEEVFHLPVSPIDVIRQLITAEKFVAPNGEYLNIRFEECTGRAHQLDYLSPEGDDDFINAVIGSRKKASL